MDKHITEPEQLVRENIRNLMPYSSARSEHELIDGIFLDANENTSGDFSQFIQGMEPGMNRYPDPFQKALKEKVGKIKGIPVENIFLGNGSDEAIDLIFRIFCVPGRDRMIICPPTYGMYEVAAAINDTGVCGINLDGNFQLIPEAILQAADPQTKILFLCSPNNPSGNLLDNRTIMHLLKNFPGIVVVDEAYVDFSFQSSLLGELANFPNLIVLQTFSKAWALAGLRIGMAFASKSLIGFFNRIKPPYNISAVSQLLALKAMENSPVEKQWIQAIVFERKRLYHELSCLPSVIKVYPSDANFFLVKFTEHEKIFQVLLGNGIVVRNRSSFQGCEGCLRITIGTNEENLRLLEILKNY